MLAKSTRSRFACLVVEHLPTRVEALLHKGDLSQRPMIVIRAWDDCVLDASPLAVGAGLGPGDSRRRVEQLCPQAILLTARENLYQSYHDALYANLANFAKAVEVHALGEFFIELSTLAQTFPSEKALALQLLAQVDQATHLSPTLGVASNKYTAARAARRAGLDRSHVVVVPPGKERQLLAPLQIADLPNPPAEVVRRLHLFGIANLGEFAELPRTAVIQQFGSEIIIYHDLARGFDPRPLTPHSPPPTITRTLAFPHPVGDRGLLMAALERVASRVAYALSESGYHTMALSMILLTADGSEHNSGGTVKPPTSDPQLLRRTVARLFGQMQLSSEVVGATVTAYPLQEWFRSAQQLTLLEPSMAAKRQRLAEVLQLLKQRFGEAVVRLASTLGTPIPLPIQVQEQPDGAPSVLRWGGWSRFVIKIHEHWRERRTWWEADHLIQRYYYQVESTGSLVFTVFRDLRGRWFLDRRRILS